MRRSVPATTLIVLCALAGRLFAAESPRVTPVVKVVQRWAPSVVNISTERIVLLRQNPFWGHYGGVFDEFFSRHAVTSLPVGAMRLKGLGSGVVVAKDGLIVTNAHVVHMASKVYAVLSEGTTAEASVLAVSPANDIAIIKIDPPKALQPVIFARDVMIGETVVSIGNPYGLENSVSAGIVSGTNRSFSAGSGPGTVTLSGLIQTDASINIGSSGGALFNLDGELAGINLALVQGAQSIGFAIPASKVRDILKEYDEARKKPAVIRIPVE